MNWYKAAIVLQHLVPVLSRDLFCNIQKRRGIPQRVYLRAKLFKSVEQYIRFYNEVRPHQTLKYQTPQTFEEKYYASFIENGCSNSVME